MAPQHNTPDGEFITVDILVSDKPLIQYPDPEGQHYIEAETGQEFTVRVKLLKGFKRLDAEVICVAPTFDGNAILAWGRYVNRLPWILGVLSDDTVLGDISLTPAFDSVSGPWKQYAFAFKSLELNEDCEAPDIISGESMRQLGSIKISVYRGGAMTRVPSTANRFKLATTFDSIPEKTLKGADIHATTSYNAKKSLKQRTTEPKVERLRGDAGRLNNFTFLYRSKAALQRLDILPPDRIASPEPESGDPQMTQAEIDEVKAQIARLQVQARLPTVIKTEDRKRPRKAYDEGDESEVEEVAPPPKKRVPTIELSDDED